MQVLIEPMIRCHFPAWPDEAIRRICSASSTRRLKKGQYLAHAGDKSGGIWLLLAGSIKTLCHDARGRQYLMNYLEPGHIIGLTPMFDRGGMMADYVCHQDSSLALVPEALFDELVMTEPKVARDIIRILSMRFRILHVLLEQHSLLSPARRLAARLMALTKLYGSPCDDGISIDLKLSQDDLAVMVGVTRPTISKEINALVRDCVVKRTTYSRLVVTDPAALRRLSQGR